MIRRNLKQKLLGFLLLGTAGFCIADEVRPAYLQITDVSANALMPTYEVLWKQPVVENRRLPIAPVFQPSCELEPLGPPSITANALVQRWLAPCPLEQGSVRIDGLTTSLTDVMLRVVASDGNHENFILRPADPSLDLSADNAESVSYLVIGIEHLVFGLDHVLFVIGLVLFIRAPLMLLKTITAFTIAHSITLALSIFELVSLPQGPVEAVIALSIVFLARELAQEEQQRSALTRSQPWVMAFAFGLLHGLGFAGALNDIGLPEDAVALSLLLFNVGIELGQIIIIIMFLLIARVWHVMTQRFHYTEAHLYTGVAFTMGVLASYWTIDRTLILL
ncbi:MAG: HupE/UreJ family protein [Pseudomonadota bacterium]|nr:HupE/UreJ family protein [Pseudomonadota bacterium]